MRALGTVDADPSGWVATYSRASRLVSLAPMRRRDFSRYYIDEGNSLRERKEPIRKLLSAWEEREVDLQEFTLCPAGATASLVILATLKALGISVVLFETPCYFGTVEQAEQLHLRFDLLPTYQSCSYRLPDVHRTLHRGNVALWLTQPRASLGFNQSCRNLESLLSQLGPKGYLVIDEVTDQSFPAHLRSLRSGNSVGRLIRIRSFTKGMGLNGFRLAAILHPEPLRRDIVAALETFGGALDIHSLLTVSTFGDDLPRFRKMLAAANEQVNALRAVAERLARFTDLSVNRLVNGYIGTLVADLTKLGRTHAERRTHLLEGCRRMRTPVMLGASSYMAKDPPREAIRLNLFMQPENIIRGINNILSIWGKPTL